MANPTGMLVARAVIALLILIPLWALWKPVSGIAVCVAWAVVSLWAALDAVGLTVRALPTSHTPVLAFGVSLLGLVNVGFALYVVLNPAALFLK